MHLVKFYDRQDLFLAAADNFKLLGEEAIKSRHIYNVALAGGSTAQAFFKTLSLQKLPSELMAKSAFYFSDERAVPLISLESNAGNAWRLLLGPLGLKSAAYFPPYNEDQRASEAALAYEKRLKERLPLNEEGIPVFDVVYLGIGEDGHTASLFPHDNLLVDIMNNERLVETLAKPVNGHERITFMPKLILSARHICVMAPGAPKAKLIDRMLNEPLNYQEWPAQLILRSGHPGLTLLVSP